jgi:hypothetical protein
MDMIMMVSVTGLGGGRPMHGELFTKPGTPRVQGGADFRGNGERGNLTANPPNRFPGPGQVELLQMGKKVGLGDHDHIGGPEDDWIFVRFVVALGDGEKDNIQVLPQIEISGTNKVAHVFDEQDINLFQGESGKGVMDHRRVKMARHARGDLNRRDSMAADSGRVVFRFQVSFQDGDPDPGGERLESGFQQAGFSRPWRGHQVDRQDPMGIEVRPDVVCDPVISRHEIFQDRHGFRFGPMGGAAAAGLTHGLVLFRKIWSEGNAERTVGLSAHAMLYPLTLPAFGRFRFKAV